ncbi:MAG: DUF1223 domain-containing protein [Alphaproteobacteria bacterium]|nr:DUF1223 domain-containing protein [Alphaproteobacteria bacterium]
MLRILFTIIGLAALAGAAPAVAQNRLVLVELYTAQGCSTCVPADAVLADLAKRRDVLALSFHIDYWDYIGWKDPFADPEFTARQRTYAARLKLPYVYTPQVLVNGVWEGRGADRRAIERAATRAARVENGRIDVRASLVGPRRLQISVDGGDRPGEADVLIVRWDSERKTEVARGENQGRSLVNINVVRSLLNVATWQGEPIELTLDLEDLGKGVGEDGFAVIVQDAGGGEVLGVARVAKK